MARWPAAVWQPVNQVGGTLRPIAVCLHHQAGSGNPAPIYASRNVSAHFWLPRSGQPYQHVDTDRQAWHGVAHNAYSIGVETEGCGTPPHADPLTEAQIDAFAQLMAWAHATHGIPLVLSEAVTTPGLNYHRCAGGPATSCPCDVRKNARAEILRRAAGGAGPPIPEAEEAGNMVLQDAATGGYWVATIQGQVYPYDGAPWLGATDNNTLNPQRFPCVGLGPWGDGYCVVLDFGAGADGDRHRRYRFPRDGSGIIR